MKLETFFKKFDLIADAPDMVAKMRDLVLEWATTGKLVEPSSTDEPASELVQRIDKHFAYLRSRSEVRGSPVEPLDTESLPVLPPTWQWVRLGNVVDYGSSAKVDSANIPENAWLLDLEDVQKDTSRLLRRKTFRESPSKSTKAEFGAGDVLYGKLRPYLNKVLVANEPGYCTTEIIPIRAFGFVDPAYLCYALKRPSFLAYANSRSYGMNLPRLGTEAARLAAFPLPPLVEQKRIVAKVDELMELCDRLEMQQDERKIKHAALALASLTRFANTPTPDNLRFLFHSAYAIPPADLRKSVLSLAVQGKLVPQDPNDEPSQTLLEVIAHKKQAMIKAKKTRQGKVSRPHSARDAPDEVPVGWEWVNLDSLCFKVTDGTHFTPRYADEGVRFVSAKDIVGGKLVFDRCKFITREEHDKLYRRCNPEFHDIVVSKSGSIGTVALIGDRSEFSLFESLALLKFDQHSLLPEFLVYALTHACASLTAGHIRGVGVKHLHLDILRGLEIALPPLAEQRRIVAKMDELMALLDQLEEQLSAATKMSAILLESAIHELVHPSAELTKVPADLSLLGPDRAAIGCYAIQQLADRHTFGRTAQMKMLYLAEAHIGLELGGRYLRDAAGPLDQWIYTFEKQAAEQQWFSVHEKSTKDGHKKIEYRKGPRLSAKAGEATARLPPECRKEFDWLLALFANRPTVEVEIIATLFAAWNDSLIDGRTPSDSEIIRDVRENWHPSKQRFKEPELKKWLDWMRQNALMPKGRGPHTCGSQAAPRVH